ncbi:MAG: NADH dehydrogenase (quinone) subunit D [Chloroflexota bacterium]|nr:MAG: NADH dehydrogenase (quinone) subunit D [Chloroflexota bacterium]
MVLNMGPQHPSTHGVLRLIVELEGERVVGVKPDIGFLHTGFEKTYENRTYHQCVVLTDRMDYLAPLSNNLAYALAVEKLWEVEIPPRAQVVRVLLAELTRIQSHLVWLGTQAIDLGAVSVFLYTYQDREHILDIFELVSGARMMTSYIRPGGLYMDLPPGFEKQVHAFLDWFPARLEELHHLLTHNEIWLQRTVGIGKIAPEDGIALGLSGPSLRASGVDWDIRKSTPYSGYEQYEFDVPLGTNGDVYDRYMVRMEEIRQSLRIVDQALQRIPEGSYMCAERKMVLPPRAELATSMEAVIHHFKLVTEGYHTPAGEVFSCIESPRGEIGFYIVSDGSGRPYRCHVKAPSFMNLQTLPQAAHGQLLADLVAIIGSLDPVLGEVDR